MIRFSSWGVSVLTIAVIFALLVCGAFSMSFQMTDSMDHATVATCDEGMCASRDVGCLEHCLSRGDAIEERIVIAPVIVLVRALSLPTFLYHSGDVAMTHAAFPPWHSHRLFALRE